MALTKCKECGNKVSSKANSCPECGAPVKGKGCLEISLRIILWIFVIGFFLTIMSWCGLGILTVGVINSVEDSGSVKAFNKQPVGLFQEADSVSTEFYKLDKGSIFTVKDTVNQWIKIEVEEGWLLSGDAWMNMDQAYHFTEESYQQWKESNQSQ